MGAEVALLRCIEGEAILAEQTWAELVGPWVGRAWINSFSPGRDGRKCIVATSRGALHHTEDGGLAWVNLPLPHLFADLRNGSLVVDPVDSLRVYAGLNDAGPVFGTEDGGATWSVIFDRGVTRLVVDPREPSHLYILAREGDLLESFDHGSTWRDLGDYRAQTGLRPQQRASTLCLAAGSRTRYLGTDAGDTPDPADPASWGHVLRLQEQGWTLLPFVAPNRAILAVHARTGPPDALLVVTSAFEIHRSADGGQHWAKVWQIPAAMVPTSLSHLVATDPRNPDLVAVLVPSTSDGPTIVVSTDFGLTWATRTPPDFSLGAQAPSLVIDHPSPEVTRFLAGAGRTDGRLWVSLDTGKHWALVDTGIADGLGILGISDDGACYATSAHRGVVKGTIAPAGAERGGLP